MKISQKGLYALKAMTMLARRCDQGAIRIRDIAYEEELPEKFLELILLELKNARMVESVRGAKGGYRLRRPPDRRKPQHCVPRRHPIEPWREGLLLRPQAALLRLPPIPSFGPSNPSRALSRSH